MLKLGVIGYGYWGPNIVRNFQSTKGARVTMVADLDQQALARAADAYPELPTTQNPEDILTSTDIDAVAVITPVFTHFELAKKALENGKHVFVEKPFTSSVEQAEALVELAATKKLQIMVDHTFLFTGAVTKIKELVAEDTLGKLFYYDSTRVNLGLFQHDINVVWDLAPHDLSIMDFIISEKPAALATTGAEHFGRGLEDVAYITVYFDSNLIAHFNVNWLSPVKVRQTLVGGEKKMLVWNDLERDEALKVYDRGVTLENRESVYNLLFNYRSGDMWAPRIEHTEALKLETKYFVDCVESGTAPFNDGNAGLRVVRMLESSDRSLKSGGKLVRL